MLVIEQICACPAQPADDAVSVRVLCGYIFSRQRRVTSRFPLSYYKKTCVTV